ncbi:uncharacterized protein OCT59_023698 [Rhizophagus irregularis]|uniref:uncharacterized protein n=1 Tax=Rhizophagus irregularis TaxID=588596 RepID=UPI001A00CBDF|nr:hypothetical protein OCT59_023698 [Rhizophagus irregularis]GET58350.1 hypothetical protein RIR_jg39613.t1 [Rhizophagus irregularis DAOM 181602=DAOM 197198]
MIRRKEYICQHQELYLLAELPLDNIWVTSFTSYWKLVLRINGNGTFKIMPNLVSICDRGQSNTKRGWVISLNGHISIHFFLKLSVLTFSPGGILTYAIMTINQGNSEGQLKM